MDATTSPATAEPSPPPDDGIPVVMPVEEPPTPPVPVAPPPQIVRPTVIAPPPEPPVVGPRARRVERPTRRHRDVVPRVVSIVPLMITLAVFAAMMATSFGQGLYALFTEAETLSLSERQVKNRLLGEMVLVEAVDTAIVLVGIVLAGAPLACPAGKRLLTWAIAAPGFLFLLGVNLGYHQFLKWLVSLAADPPDNTTVIDVGLQDGGWAILLVCVQPAVIEELFFRYLLFGHLRPHLGLHGAVWISAVIFGMAHLGNIPGWPVLILLGAGLGYARAYSGNLVLPILLHFLHNLAVLLIDFTLRHP